MEVVGDVVEDGVAVTDGACDVGSMAASVLGFNIQTSSSDKIFDVGSVPVLVPVRRDEGFRAGQRYLSRARRVGHEDQDAALLREVDIPHFRR